MSDAQIAPNGHIHPCPQWWDDAEADDGCTCARYGHTARPVGGDTREALREEAAKLLYPGLFPADAYQRHPLQIDRVAEFIRAALDAQETHGPGRCVSIEDANRVLAEERARLERALVDAQEKLWRVEALLPEIEVRDQRDSGEDIADMIRDAIAGDS